MIDAHHHFWDPQRGDYDWLTPDMTAFWRVFGPQDLAPPLARCNVQGTVLVQAAPTEAECDYMLGIAEQTPWVLGVVGWLDLRSAQAPKRIMERAAHRKFVGVRPMLQDLPDVSWIAQEEIEPAFRALIAADLTFDALIRVGQVSHIAALAECYPDLAIVIDHAAKPDIAGSETKHWSAAMRKLAGYPNVVCKLSGLLTEADVDAATEDLQFYIDTLLQTFGPERLLWGSDWPVLTAAADYDTWMSMTHQLLSALSGDARADVMGRNAIAFYGLTAA
jgi:L-fuconolactonase